MLSTTTGESSTQITKTNNFTMTTQLASSPGIVQTVENGSPWLGSPIQRSSAEAECEYYDCDTDIDMSGLGISLKQLKLQPTPPADANTTFTIDDEEFLEPDTEIDGNFAEMLKIALQTQELEFREKVQEKEELIKTLKETVEQQKLKSEESKAKVADYEKRVQDRSDECMDLANKLEATKIEKNQTKEECKQLLQDVNACEDAFSLLHKNYEKVKVILENFTKNEELLSVRSEQLNQLVDERDKKWNYLKAQTEEKMTRAKREYEEKLREVESEHGKFKAMMCMSEVQIRQLEAGVTQKTREAEQLRELCEELIKGKPC